MDLLRFSLLDEPSEETIALWAGDLRSCIYTTKYKPVAACLCSTANFHGDCPSAVQSVACCSVPLPYDAHHELLDMFSLLALFAVSVQGDIRPMI